MNIEDLTLRQLQLETARALAIFPATNHNLARFNKLAHHNSQNWYKEILKFYVEQYGDLPSKTGPGVEVKLLLE